MNLDDTIRLRLQHLSRIVAKEALHLATTDQRLFEKPFTPQRAAQLENDPDLAERVDAFVSRFGRLQDTIGDRLLPVLPAAPGEPVGAAIDNLDRAERLKLIDLADDWLATRRLRNQMVSRIRRGPDDTRQRPADRPRLRSRPHRYRAAPDCRSTTKRLGMKLPIATLDP